jgi:hypothetical protein
MIGIPAVTASPRNARHSCTPRMSGRATSSRTRSGRQRRATASTSSPSDTSSRCPARSKIRTRHGEPTDLQTRYPGVEFGWFIRVTDAESLDRACRAARAGSWTVLGFQDPTKVPLEIVLAATADSTGRIVTVATDPTDAAVLLGVLEHGPDGVLMAATVVGDTARLKAAVRHRGDSLNLVELTVTALAHLGMGERACVDTCAYLGLDEGILVGSSAGRCRGTAAAAATCPGRRSGRSRGRSRDRQGTRRHRPGARRAAPGAVALADRCAGRTVDSTSS